VSEERVPRAKRSNSWGGDAILDPPNALIRPKKAERLRYARRRPREPSQKRVFWMLRRSPGPSEGATTSHQNVGWIADWVPQPRGPIQRDLAPSRLRGGRRETKKVIMRGEGYTYIADLLSPDLLHTTKREGDTSVTVVTSKNYHWWWRAFLTSGCCSVYVFSVHGGGVDNSLPH
jgi:hypothetical protein